MAQIAIQFMAPLSSGSEVSHPVEHVAYLRLRGHRCPNLVWARNIAWTASSACARGSGRRRAFLGAQLFSASSSQSMMAVQALPALIEALQELQKEGADQRHDPRDLHEQVRGVASCPPAIKVRSERRIRFFDSTSSERGRWRRHRRRGPR